MWSSAPLEVGWGVGGLRRKKAQSSQGVRKGGRGGNTQDKKRREPQSREGRRREQAEVKQDVAIKQNRKGGNAGGNVRETDKGGKVGKDVRKVGGSRLGLIFSLYNCESLWVFLAVKSCFTINLRILTLVLHGWRGLEASVREGPKHRGR